MLQSTAVVLLAMFWASLYLLDSFVKVALFDDYINLKKTAVYLHVNGELQCVKAKLILSTLTSSYYYLHQRKEVIF